MERNHRHNHRMPLIKRVNFPNIGHYDTWIIDALQILYKQKCNTLLFQDWSNALDYIDTPESFGTISLHDDGLQHLLDSTSINYNNIRLAKDQKYIVKAMGTTLPFLPMHTILEKNYLLPYA